MTRMHQATRVDIPREVLLRDMLIFQLKLWLDGVKDIALAPMALFATIADWLFGRPADGYLLYRVMRTGERFDLWLNLYGPARRAEGSREGLFGASSASDETLLGRLESASGGERGETRREP
ncbi:MAG: hypothetical protein ACRELV_03400 [Longimicrobiales bacterium]